MDLRCGTRMSLRQVRKPHMKKRVVTTASGRVVFAGVSETETGPWSALGGTHEGTCASSRAGGDSIGRGLTVDADRVDAATGRGLMRASPASPRGAVFRRSLSRAG